MKSIAVLLSVVASSVALAETTGPGAKLFKLNDKWVSVLPTTTTDENAGTTAVPAATTTTPTTATTTTPTTTTPVAAIPAPTAKIPTAVAPVAASSAIPGYTPDANYSGACHVTVNLAEKTYAINATSNTAMVTNQATDSVCLPTEKLAIDYGFKKSL